MISHEEVTLKDTTGHIAIVGIGCRFPGGISSPASFWDFLCSGGDGISHVPADRWDIKTFYHPDREKKGKVYTQKGGFLSEIDRFDPQFFGISPREASHMDPQQRLLLEVTWEALEDGGMVPEKLAGTNVGVFVGLFMHDYENIHTAATEHALYDPHSVTGMSTTIAANRLSYVFDFRGPSMVIDTACSSSLVAVHLACRSLREKETSLAVAGGVNVLIKPEIVMTLCQASMLSPDGYCKSFDARANGYARSEGAGVVVMKRLTDALADGDPIYAVIRGSAVNQDGRSEGITVPSGDAQKAVVQEALRTAGVAPHTVSYVEAHGTGTPVGDLIEAEALGTILSKGRSNENRCIVGSVKSNIGHTESAAGVASLIKVALMLRHHRIPPNLHFETPNPEIQFDRLKLRVPTSLETWTIEGNAPRIAGINSFGFGGTNAHVVLQEFDGPVTPDTAKSDSSKNAICLVPLSANSQEALRELARRHYEMLVSDTSGSMTLYDLGFTASLCRGHHSKRMTIAARSLEDYREHLEAFLRGERRPGLSLGSARHGTKPKIAFVFSGMGQQWWAMGRRLLEEEPVFRNIIDECDALFGRHTGEWSLIGILTADEDQSNIDETMFAQPSIFSIQVALAGLLRSRGIVPDAIVGHSVGEIAAAYTAGALTLEDAVKVCYHRSRLQHTLAGRGAMLAVGLSAEDVEKRFDVLLQDVSMAAFNSPNSVTLSGDKKTLEEIAAVLEAEKVFGRFLKVDVPYHSPSMDPVLQDLEDSLRTITPHPVSAILVSTVTGKTIDGQDMNGGYWCLNAREPILFQEAMDELVRHGCDLFVEIGAHPVLSASIMECLDSAGIKGIVVPTLRRAHDEEISIARVAGELYCSGYHLDWRERYAGEGRFIKLPTYPWQKEHYWTESEESRQARTGEGMLSVRMGVGPKAHPLLGGRLAAALPTWSASIDLEDLNYLRDHMIQGSMVFPGAGYVEMALAGARQINGYGSYVLESVSFTAPLILRGEASPIVQFVMEGDETFSVYSKSADDKQSWVKHAGGKLRPNGREETLQTISVSGIRKRCSEEIPVETFYNRFRSLGLDYGPAFRNIKTIYTGERESLGMIETNTDTDGDEKTYYLHPATLDACFQLLGVLSPGGTFLPVGIDRISTWSRPNGQIWGHARLVEQSGRRIRGDISLLDDSGNILVEIKGLRCRNIEETSAEFLDDLLYQYEWRLTPLGGGESSYRDARYLPAPGRIKAGLEPVLKEILEMYSRKEYYSVIEPKLNALCTAYIVEGMRTLGFQFGGQEPFTTEEFCSRFGIALQHGKLCERLLSMLAKEGWLSGNGREWKVGKKRKATSPQKLWNALMTEHPECQAELILIDRCGSKLVEVLRGDEDPLGLIFEPGSTVAEHLYYHSPTMRIYNRLLRELMLTVLDHLPEGQTIRILEVGAGTGAVTSFLLPILHGRQAEYVFTDISKTLINAAQEAFREYPFVEFRQLDIEKDPVEQGFDPNSFDLVIASDVVHATENLHRTLDNIKPLLASDGLVMMLELTNPSYLFDLIFGMLDGWWLFSDYDLRPDHATMPRAGWENVLTRCGFSDIVMIDDHIDDHAPTQSIIVTRGPSIEPPLTEGEIGISKETSSQTKRPWLILADESGIYQQLTVILEEKGILPSIIKRGDSFKEVAPRCFTIRPNEPDDVEQAIGALCPDGESSPVIINLWNAEPGDTVMTGQLLEDTVTNACMEVAGFVQALSKRPWETVPDFWLVTGGTHPIGSNSDIALNQTPLWGFGRVIITEHPNIRLRLVDLSRVPSERELVNFCEELLSDNSEDEIALRGSDRYVHRLVQTTGCSRPDPDDDSFTLHKTRAKSSKDFLVIEAQRHVPGPGEVELKVYATGLNFKDVAKVSGLLDDLDDDTLFSLGMEASGVILRVGEGVKNIKAGDSVMGLVQTGFSNYIVTDAYGLVPKPDHLTFEQAAGIPLTFMTAFHALHSLARIREGERILVHTGSGGLGLAMIQVARAAGAEVYATAGTPEKRSFLRTMGIPYVGDSRGLDFARELPEMTNNEGVDIVVNTLPATALEANISVLKPVSGRLIDLAAIQSPASLEMRLLGKGISIAAFDLEAMKRNTPEYLGSLLHQVADRFCDKTLHPLPHRVFPVTDVARAFRNMRKASHIGKQILSMREINVIPVPTQSTLSLNPDATYLIAGGLGGFGMAVARWMVLFGARYLVLVGRHSDSSPKVHEDLKILKKSGATVRVIQADITSEEHLKSVFEEIDLTMPPLRGVVQSAMVLDDGPVMEMTSDRIKRVVAPKVQGAWNLHILTLKKDLDFFICFSSFASLIGNANQASYSAGNAFLDALADYRKARGLPALTISWGALGETGYVAEHEEIKDAFRRQGVTGLTLDKAWQVIRHGLKRDVTHIGAMSAHWPTLSRFSYAVANSPRFSELIQREYGKAVGGVSETEDRIRTTLPASGEERHKLLEEVLIQVVSRVLGLSPSGMDIHQPLSSMGFDSLMAVELSLAVENAVGVVLPKVEYLRRDLTVAVLVKVIEKGLPESGFIVYHGGIQSRVKDQTEDTNGGAESTRFMTLGQDSSLSGGGDQRLRAEAGKREDILSKGKGNVYGFDGQSLPRAEGFIYPPEYLALKENSEQLETGGYKNFYFNISDGINSNITSIEGRKLINYSSYNYLGMSGDPVVVKAAKDAIDRYGTSVSASRIASGERIFHRELENELSGLIGAEDCIAFVSGFGTNENVIGHVCRHDDLVLHDSLIHASVQQGATLSGARVLPFPHNNYEALDRILNDRRENYRQVLIVIEGVYSMDGDIPDLPCFIEIKKHHKALLMVDEAHSIGVLGEHGRGIGEYYSVDPGEVDLWMGTLSKAFASCGGYIAGSRDMVEFLKYTAPGFVYSVGMTPPDAAAALAALRLLKKEPERVTRLQQNISLFREMAKERGFNTGKSKDSAVIPLILGQSLKSIRMYKHLKEQDIFALPIVYPAVPENAARIRFFLSSLHTDEQIVTTISAISAALSADPAS